MMPHDELEDQLRAHYAAVRATDTSRAPAFGEMLARARATVAAGAPPVAARPVASPPAWRRVRTWAIGGPLLLAAGLAGIWLQPSRVADREFEKVVSEWSRTADRSLHSPTDGLLTLPGSEYLRGLPAVGAGAARARRPS